jgi:hypothetical protein
LIDEFFMGLTLRREDDVNVIEEEEGKAVK